MQLTSLSKKKKFKKKKKGFDALYTNHLKTMQQPEWSFVNFWLYVHVREWGQQTLTFNELGYKYQFIVVSALKQLMTDQTISRLHIDSLLQYSVNCDIPSYYSPYFLQYRLFSMILSLFFERQLSTFLSIIALCLLPYQVSRHRLFDTVFVNWIIWQPFNL